jgi:3-deoxy-D-manno-octulosonic-acid transferase
MPALPSPKRLRAGTALYSASVGLYHLAVRCAALWNPKAKAWVKGREGLWARLGSERDALRGCLWMHCASVGEFEQGRPVLEAIKAQRPDLPVLLTFFSPSGYEARKDYPLATHVDYLPPDSAANAHRLVELIAPRASIFVKYEFWYHHLHALKARSVPTFLVSAIFRKNQPFFTWYGGAWRDMLTCYTHIFTQDEGSRALLGGIDVKNVSVGGDTRFDRVMAIVAADEELPLARAVMQAGGSVLVCGSTWPKDERLLLDALQGARATPRILIAPHELEKEHLASIDRDFPEPLMTWSAFGSDATAPQFSNARTLLVDRIGLLARLYKYADVAYVGGGFGDGIHSLLEAAAWGKPVIFGPKHTKFAEAQGLIDAGGGFEVRNAEELRTVLDRLLGDKIALARASQAAGKYVRDRVGATERTVGEVLPRIG